MKISYLSRQLTIKLVFEFLAIFIDCPVLATRFWRTNELPKSGLTFLVSNQTLIQMNDKNFQTNSFQKYFRL
jgi:hypothetical protein